MFFFFYNRGNLFSSQQQQHRLQLYLSGLLLEATRTKIGGWGREEGSFTCEEVWPRLLQPAPYYIWPVLMASSNVCDTDVLLGAGYCLAQRNQVPPMHKSNTHAPSSRPESSGSATLRQRRAFLPNDPRKWPRTMSLHCYFPSLLPHAHPKEDAKTSAPTQLKKELLYAWAPAGRSINIPRGDREEA